MPNSHPWSNYDNDNKKHLVMLAKEVLWLYLNSNYQRNVYVKEYLGKIFVKKMEKLERVEEIQNWYDKLISQIHISNSKRCQIIK